MTQPTSGRDFTPPTDTGPDGRAAPRTGAPRPGTDDPRVAVLHAWLPALNGDEAARLAIADEVASMPGGTVPAETLRARTLLESGRPTAVVAEQVQASLDRVFAIDPDDIEARYVAAILRARQSPKDTSATDEFTRLGEAAELALADHPRSLPAHALVAATGAQGASLAAARRLVTLADGTSWAWAMLATRAVTDRDVDGMMDALSTLDGRGELSDEIRLTLLLAALRPGAEARALGYAQANTDASARRRFLRLASEALVLRRAPMALPLIPVLSLVALLVLLFSETGARILAGVTALLVGALLIRAIRPLLSWPHRGEPAVILMPTQREEATLLCLATAVAALAVAAAGVLTPWMLGLALIGGVLPWVAIPRRRTRS